MAACLVSILAAANAAFDARTSTDFAISYRSDPQSPAAWCGVYILPGDAQFRSVVGPSGAPVWRESVKAAEADAGHALVAALQQLKRTAGELEGA